MSFILASRVWIGNTMRKKKTKELINQSAGQKCSEQSDQSSGKETNHPAGDSNQRRQAGITAQAIMAFNWENGNRV